MTKLHRRGGLTLVELLVVIAIIGLLAGIVGLIAPRFAERSRVAEGSRQFTAWLQIARQRALRDKAPRGIRIVTPPGATMPQIFYTQFQYIEQPEDITGQPAEIQPLPGPANSLGQRLRTRRNVYQQAAMEALAAANRNHPMIPLLNPNTNPDGWKYILPLAGRDLSAAAKANDVVEFGGARYTLVVDPFQVKPANDYALLLHRKRDEVRDAMTSGMSMLNTPLPAYRITRTPRPIAGEAELNLPRDVAIDFYFPTAPATTPTRTIPVPQAGGTGQFDIMFSPSGEVVGGVGALGRIVFWMRDVSLNDPGPGKLPDGENRLIVLHCRTGQVTAHPVNQTIGTSGQLLDPYTFVRDGKSSSSED